MKNIIIAALLSISSVGLCRAQDDADPPRKPHQFDHYIGVQINELTKQILGVNNTSTVADNPYLFTYHLTERSSGLGFRVGSGFNYISQTLDGGGKSTVKSFNCRIGFEKTFKLSDKWSTGVGLDLLYKNVDTSYDQQSAYGYKQTYKSKKIGAGPMGWLRYSLSKKILVGTEISMYYLTGNDKMTSSYTSADSDEKVSEFKFNLPVVFFLSMKL
ncbi:hypothetical protein CJD36_006055 [Flavipsychrobacter stenotrophus]|uniref:Outer membrane protein beta-barrel domain-containing protein n=1 Tax=Flavipsychrobacter stenotrophus TaxID=2077091 RepID=A0A2S7SWQ3_9BACT|nr:hypothetical protein [Flavipsychrobacter stenotrophus]PQJ11362.1 hypothetical protein CJD36_006055 [Flavipsychrobacter stenotrophus]